MYDTETFGRVEGRRVDKIEGRRRRLGGHRDSVTCRPAMATFEAALTLKHSYRMRDIVSQFMVSYSQLPHGTYHM